MTSKCKVLINIRLVIGHAKDVVNSKFARNVAIVATGTAGAQAITLAYSPVITRLYGPEAFGVLATFTAVLAVLTPLAALSYPIAIVLPQRDEDAVGLAKVSFATSLATSLLTAIVLVSFKTPIVKNLNLQAVESFILLVPVAMMFSVAMAVLSQWVIRKKLFKIKARVAVLQAFWLNSAKVGIGLITPAASVLVILAALGSGLHALMLWTGVRNSQNGRLELSGNREDSIASGKKLAREHNDFAYYRTPQHVLSAASQTMPVLILAGFSGPATAGFYSLGKMVLEIPVRLIGQSVSSVFYPRINEAVHKGEDPHRLLIRATVVLMAVGVIPFGVVVVLGPWLFRLVFGAEWAMAGAYAQWLALWSYFVFINRPSVGAIPVLSIQGQYLMLEIVSIIVRFGALVLGLMWYESAIVAIAMFSIVSVLLSMALIAMTLLAARTYRGATST